MQQHHTMTYSPSAAGAVYSPRRGHGYGYGLGSSYGTVASAPTVGVGVNGAEGLQENRYEETNQMQQGSATVKYIYVVLHKQGKPVSFGEKNNLKWTLMKWVNSNSCGLGTLTRVIANSKLLFG
ncbi:hypothetical protein L6164_028483 [Bauhinia variegata]|uniref:Uncharacterized protein n=1 Tax=Bauhinia variegata TaxID=167791 RepID=A0ACB9L6B9_BAUVA|nr:hypothetical protein L6164_028483 [Bauhinia variegata]